MFQPIFSKLKLIHSFFKYNHCLLLTSTRLLNSRVLERIIPNTLEDFKSKNQLTVDQPENAKLHKIAIIGLPNSGKSTLTNQLMGQKISSVSTRVHTTRKNVIGVFNYNSTQVEILDSPGLVRVKQCIKHNLEYSLLNHPHLSANIADTLVILVDVSQKKYRHFLSLDIWKILNSHRQIRSILVLNKVDKVKNKQKLLNIIDNLTGCYIENKSIEGSERFTKQYSSKNMLNELDEIISRNMNDQKKESIEKQDLNDPMFLRKLSWPNFSKVFMISALTGDGVDDLKKYLIETAKPGPWKYHESIVTLQNPKEILLSLVREKMLDQLKEEVPYTLELKIDLWEITEDGCLNVVVLIFCTKEKHLEIVIGPKGKNIAKVAALAKEDISNAFACDFNIKLIVKLKHSKSENFKK